MNNPLAPIVLFVYNRPWHTKKTLEALSENLLAQESSLIIFVDGPKVNCTSEQLELISQVKMVVAERLWCGKVEIVERESNLGLANSIIKGVTDVVNKYGKVIVLEDDIITSKGFLKFMNDGLNVYEKEDKVMHVSGYIYPVKEKLPDFFFYQSATCWGWGTWARAWKKFNPNALDLLNQLNRSDIFSFNLDDSYNFYGLLKLNASMPNDSWATRWYASMFLNNGLSLHPGRSLTHNIGNDGSGTHPHNSKVYDVVSLAEKIEVAWKEVKVDGKARSAIVKYFSGIKPSFFQRAELSVKYRGALLLAKLYKLKPIIWNDMRSVSPFSRKFGMDRGKSIDRYYIEHFLEKEASRISGNVLEIAETTYTKKYGQNILSATSLTFDKTMSEGQIVGDLTDVGSLPNSSYDCFVCTQTLNFIYNFEQAIEGIFQLLKKEGTALVTVAGICQISRYDADRWGDYWRFTVMSMQKAFGDVFGEGNISVDYYGNCLSAIAILKGLASEELKKSELDYKDRDYPVIITIVAKKV